MKSNERTNTNELNANGGILVALDEKVDTGSMVGS